MPVEYTVAESVRDFADQLIKNHHPHLTNVKIEYVFRSQAATKNGKAIWGRAKLVTGLNAWLATPMIQRWNRPEPFFCLEIARDIWSRLNENQQKALVDHELSHCDRDLDSGDLTIVGHDLEEFAHILRRHGLWHSDVEMFAKTGAEQLSLLSIIEQRAETADLAETVTIQRLNGQSLTLSREELLSAFYKLEAESKLGIVLDSKLGTVLDKVTERINSGSLDSDSVTVTAKRTTSN
ncbi:MAG: hypothetical protein JNK38_01045 [Acidobacteria bacterium]|nr:hypothetical protein [Acidobacteriota bacterium]